MSAIQFGCVKQTRLLFQVVDPHFLLGARRGLPSDEESDLVESSRFQIPQDIRSLERHTTRHCQCTTNGILQVNTFITPLKKNTSSLKF